jgi:hypothetical protein
MRQALWFCMLYLLSIGIFAIASVSLGAVLHVIATPHN